MKFITNICVGCISNFHVTARRNDEAVSTKVILFRRLLRSARNDASEKLKCAACVSILLICLAFVFNKSYAQSEQYFPVKNVQFPIPRLSPRPATVAGANDPVISLNGKWQFAIDNTNKGHIEVPGEWEMQGYFLKEGQAGIYTREFNIPEDWKGKRIKLRFDAVSSHATVWINGEKIGEHEGEFVPFEFDITRAVHVGQNQLKVTVRALTISDRLSCVSQYAGHTVGGIVRKVTLFTLPDVNIADNFVTTTFDKQYNNAELHFETSLANESDAPALTEIEYRLYDAHGKLYWHKKVNIHLSITVGKIQLFKNSFLIKYPHQWNPEHPYLYQLTTTLFVKGEPVQTDKRKVGFREVLVKGNILLVNGKPVKLHGVCRHETYPLTGRSISPALCLKDALLFRNGNCNYIRTSHYPPSEEFLNDCDSLGLFVECESALCWIGHGASPIWRKWNYEDPKFLPYLIQSNAEKMIAYRDHPSVIIWSLANESRWSPLWAKVNEVVKKLDPSRPTTFQDQCWGGYNNARSKADIANYHYPAENGPAACDTMKRPVLFDEYDHISCYSRREIITDPGVRSDYGKFAVQMYDSMYAHPACLGGAIWAGIDDIFQLPDGRIEGYGPWGVIDGWRRKKPEYYGMKKAYSPVHIMDIKQAKVKDGYIDLQMQNRYDFTNLKDVKIVAKEGNISQNISCNIPPHDKGILRIPTSPEAKQITLTFEDPRGFICDRELISLQKDTLPPITSQEAPVKINEKDSMIYISVGTRRYIISKTDGLMTAAFMDDKLVLDRGPVFGMVPMNNDDGGKPNFAGNSYQNNIYPLKNYSFIQLFAKKVGVHKENDGSVLVNMNVVYDKGEGTQSYLFKPDGTVTVKYHVTLNEDVRPRQYGLFMTLPLDMQTISWKRNGAFSIYPKNDIARNEGQATLNANDLLEVQPMNKIPDHPWKEDANALGSRDFRATKSHIYWAKLQNNKGDGILILSNGKQAIRCWKQHERIQMLVADYNNSGSEPFYTGLFVKDHIHLKKGSTVSGEVTFRLFDKGK